MKVGIDIDGVLADLVAEFLPHLSEATGRPVTYVDITQYHMGRAVGLPDTAFLELWARVEGSLYKNALPYPNVAAALADLYRRHEVHLITHRPAIWRQSTEGWLQQHFQVALPLEHRERTVEKFATTDEFDAFIEDQFEVVIAHAAVVQRAILVDRPWNQGALPFNAYRVPDFASAIAVLDAMSK